MKNNYHEIFATFLSRINTGDYISDTREARRMTDEHFATWGKDRHRPSVLKNTADKFNGQCEKVFNFIKSMQVVRKSVITKKFAYYQSGVIYGILSKLEHDGRIVSTIEKTPYTRGAPKQLYSLSAVSYESNTEGE